MLVKIVVQIVIVGVVVIVALIIYLVTYDIGKLDANLFPISWHSPRMR